MEALLGDERAALASDYLARQLRAPFWGAPHDGVRVRLEMPLGEGDVRPLVRHLRAIAVYAAGLLASDVGAPLDQHAAPRWLHVRGTGGGGGGAPGGVELQLVEGGEGEWPPGGGGGGGGGCARRGAALQLRLSAARNLLPQDGRLLHPDAAPLLAALAPPPPSPPPSASPPASLLNGLGPAAGGATAVMAELRHVLDLWLCGALAPAVLVCTCREHAEQLWRGLEARLGGRAALIRGVDPLEVSVGRARAHASGAASRDALPPCAALCTSSTDVTRRLARRSR